MTGGELPARPRSALPGVVAGELSAAGIERPEAEARALVDHACGAGEGPCSQEQAARLDDLVRRRCRHEPLEYLLGEAEFMGRRFAVDPRVQVTRPHMAVVVREAGRAVVDLAAAGRGRPTAVDVGTGCGALAICLALDHPELAPIDALDVSVAALEVAATNVERHGLVRRVRLLESDLLQALPGTVDLIMANLPFVRADQTRELAPGVLEHEPALAVFGGGESGWGLQRRLLAEAGRHLRPGGVILVTLHDSQETEARQAASACFPDARHTFLPINPGWSRLLRVDVPGIAGHPARRSQRTEPRRP